MRNTTLALVAALIAAPVSAHEEPPTILWDCEIIPIVSDRTGEFLYWIKADPECLWPDQDDAPAEPVTDPVRPPRSDNGHGNGSEGHSPAQSDRANDDENPH